ncbi:hypothetical protein PENSOL_c077G02615 [Penicillium solitum]|uniref:AMP-dependent synthetase/ligase domain-containing protein n=1 Tax=Penicillium solitum TaxID=60172 RepID=A0A1V6QE08_9EURO|nr:uncharacterized protein PENSOL_c077G02615 [Penicillium solitum]OQD87458.1 hypothetical protein PENSOL_c077G02615 [Penicillium solitum]
MAIITSNTTVHMRTDRSITQLMLENPSNTEPQKLICEDTLTGKVVTYGQLRSDAFESAHSLRHRHSISPGDVVTIIARSNVDYILAAHSIWAAGAVVSTINHSSATKELVHALKVVNPKLIIADVLVLEKLHEALGELKLGTMPTILTMINRKTGYSLFPDDLLGHSSRVESEAYVLDGKDARNACAAIVLSSGTTGLQKAVMLSHHNLVAISEQLRAHNPDNWRGSMREVFFPILDRIDRKMLIMAVSHIYGLYVCALLGPWLGYYVCLLTSFDLETFCRLLHDKRATLARLVPPVALALAESPVTEKYKYPDLEYFSCSAAPLKPLVATKLRSKFPGVSLCQTYGCTELSSCVSQSGVRDKGAPLVATGTLLANIKIRFIDDNCEDVSPPNPGEICVSSPTIMMGYKDDQKSTADAMLEPGWYRTGDIGYLDSDGYLIIIDRIKDVIKYKGFQVSPTELEEIIGQHGNVADAAVTSVWDDNEATEIPQAFVVPKVKVFSSDRKILSEEIQRMVASKVAGYKKLRGGIFFVDQLPRNPTGKLLRRELRNLARVKANI